MVQFTELYLSEFEFPLDKYKSKKLVIYQYVGTAYDITRSIQNLLTGNHKQTFASTILLRTLLEINIRMTYLFCAKGQQNLLKYVRESFRKKISGTLEWHDFLINNPHFQNTLNINHLLTEIPNWKKAQHKIEAIFFRRYKHKQFKTSSLKDMVQEIDDWNNLINPNRKNKNNLMWSYLTVYKYWSQIVHQDIDGLNQYMNKTPKGYELMINGNPDDEKRISIATFACYLNIVNIFSLQFGFPSQSELKPFKKRLKYFENINL